MVPVQIIMATYNGERYIKEQIDSIIASTYKDWVLTIYDDGSTDDTLSILKKYEEQYPEQIQVVKNKENKGVIGNFLQGVQNSKLSYIMFCDQDDVWLPEKIKLTLTTMLQEEKRRKNKPLSVFTDARVVDQDLTTIHESFFKSNQLDPSKLDLAHMLMENKLIGCTVMINEGVKNLITTLPKKGRLHDWWIGLISATFGDIVFLPEQTLLYRQHSNNVVGNQSYVGYVMKRFRTIFKQKDSIKANYRQAAEFYQIYKNHIMDQQKKDTIEKFTALEHMPWYERKYTILKYGFLKTGIIRNIGLLLIV